MNNYFPQPNYINNPYQRFNPGIIWVQGIEGAKAFMMAPNASVILMDSENEGVFYIKISDNVGFCTLRTFHYNEVFDATAPATVQPEMPTIDMSQYVTKEELANAIKEVRGGRNNNGKQSV